jgi:peptide deformylase
MAIRTIRVWPDPELTKVAKKVSAVDDSTRALIADLFETMYDANGVGLAATQIAVHQRVLVIDLDPHGEAKEDPEVKAELDGWGFPGPLALVNPEIVFAEGEILWDEGCLSVPGITEKVKRRERVRVRALNAHGESFEVEANGLFAVALQHEMDHLEGKVFVEYLSKLKREAIRRKMERLKVEGIDDGVDAAMI